MVIGNMKHNYYFTQLVVVLVILFANKSAIAQEGPVASTANLAMRYYYDNHDLVAEGSFVRMVDNEFQLPVLIRRDIQAVFEIEKIYKATENLTGNEIIMSFTSDMLVYPGENISRYAKRRSILDDLSLKFDELNSRREDIESRYSDNAITETQYNNLFALLNQEYEALVTQSASISKGTDAIIGSKSFYDLRGAIIPGQKYLIFTNKAADNYLLDAVGSNSYIYWGERMEILSNILESEVVIDSTN